MYAKSFYSLNSIIFLCSQFTGFFRLKLKMQKQKGGTIASA